MRSVGSPCGLRSARDRIEIAPFEWRKRRWTKSPGHQTVASNSETVPPRSSSPKQRPLWSRLFSRAATAESAIPSVAQLLPAAIVVRALADESGFDLRRSQRLRAAWSSLGHSGSAQAGHLGQPHAFIPTGQHTTMIPRLASENLRDERSEIFDRARG